MATRAAARPLRRHVNARVRAAALPASYTTTWDTTTEAHKSGLQVWPEVNPRTYPTKKSKRRIKEDLAAVKSSGWRGAGPENLLAELVEQRIGEKACEASKYAPTDYRVLLLYRSTGWLDAQLFESSGARARIEAAALRARNQFGGVVILTGSAAWLVGSEPDPAIFNS